MRADDGWLRDEYWIYAEYHTHAQQNVTIQLRFQPWFQLRFQRFQLWFLDHPPVLWFLGLPTQRGHYFCWQEIRHHPHPQAPDGDKAIAALTTSPRTVQSTPRTPLICQSQSRQDLRDTPVVSG